MFQIWNKACLEKNSTSLCLKNNLQLLIKDYSLEILSQRSFEYLSLEDRKSDKFISHYKNIPLKKPNLITIANTIRKDSWTDGGCSYLVVGTENKEIIIIDHRSLKIIF